MLLGFSPQIIPDVGLSSTQYGFLGRVYALEDFTLPSTERMQQLRRHIAERLPTRRCPA